MKIFYDTEFLEDGRTIELISIGMVAESGDEYYAINRDFDTDRLHDNPWLVENVVPSLPLTRGYAGGERDTWLWDPDLPNFDKLRRRSQIADDVRQFVLSHPYPELWAWYGAYDHVALAQLFGRMIDLPEGVPMWTNDLKQECVRLGNPRLPNQTSAEHDALADARWVRDAYVWMHAGEDVAA